MIDIFILSMLNIGMKKKDAIAYFKTPGGVAVAAGISPAAVSQWGENVPLGTAALLEKATNGKLRLDPACYRRKIPIETHEAA